MQKDMREWVENERLKRRQPYVRKCLVCGYEGEMKTWLSNYGSGWLSALILLCFLIIPGLIFIIWGWGKFKCPNCGAIGKSTPFVKTSSDDINQGMKSCPFCAELIKTEAVKCRYCGSELV